MFPTVMNSLFVGVFSFSLICESVTSQFLSFVPHGEKTLVKKGLLRRGQRKVGVSEGLPTLVTLYLFFVGTTHIFSELTHLLSKFLTELYFETPAGLTFYNYLKRSSRSRNRLCRRTATSSHFWSSRKHRIAHGNSAQDCFGIAGYSVHQKIRSQMKTITRSFLWRNQPPGVLNLQRGWSCK